MIQSVYMKSCSVAQKRFRSLKIKQIGGNLEEFKDYRLIPRQERGGPC
jgi:hypothetical protein